MKQIILVSLALVTAIFALPFVFATEAPLISGQAKASRQPLILQEYASETSIFATPAPITTPSPVPVLSDAEVSIKAEIGGQETVISLKDYILGVLTGEMPAAFPPEAIKAQAVAVRTLVMRDHEALYCDDPAHCMAYAKPDGDYPAVFIEAVEQTDGQILVYDSEPILAVFFSTSSGRTERAEDVWGGGLPYLQAVESTGEEDAPRYKGGVSVSASDFWKTVREEYPDSVESGEPFGAITRSQSGGVLTIEIGGVPIPGADMRRMFELNSTNFIVASMDGEIVFETLGYGHGVGLSQYGARAMAVDSADYKAILAHYYPETELVNME